MDAPLVLQFTRGVRRNADGTVEIDNPLVTQNAHGFTISNNVPIPAYVNGAGLVVAAQANDANTLSAFFITEIVNVNQFRTFPGGFFFNAPSHGLTVGQYYFLSETVAGGVTATPNPGQIQDPVFFVFDANTLILLDNRPFIEQQFLPYAVKVTNTDTTTDINETPAVEVPLNGSVAFNEDSSTYNPTGNGIQVLRADGYTLRASIHVSGIVTRANQLIRFAINGVPTGNIAATGYIRDTSGHNEASYTLLEDLNLNANDIVTVVAEEEAGGGIVTLAQVGSSSLFIKRRRVS
jgi:hypothetical protein